MIAPALLALVLLAPLASLAPFGIGIAAAIPYDPLVVHLHGHLAADGSVVEAPPPAGALAFPASTPAAPAAPLRFSLDAPVRFAPVGGFRATLVVRADAPVATGDGLELSLAPGGSTVRVALPPVMAPGEVATVSARVDGAAEHARGERLELSVRALAPALADDALVLLVGGDAPSRLDVPDMRVPGVADLELQDAPLAQYLVGPERFGSPAHVLRVGHAGVEVLEAPNASHVVLEGHEEPATAAEHSFPDRERRVAAAHAFRVDGQLARVVPGVGVIVPVSGLARVECVAHCPEGGFARTLGLASDAGAPEERPSALVPPPRETRGIPVSEDEPPKERTPLAPLAALAGLALAARSRKR